MFIKWEKPDLNQQVKHINLTLSLNVTYLNFSSTQCCQRNVTTFVTSLTI